MIATTLKREVDGREYDIWVKNDGTFGVNVDRETNEVLEAATLKGLLEKLRELARRRKRPAVEVTLLEEPRYDARRDVPTLVDALATGIHAGNGNVLVQREKDGRVEQIRSYSETLLRRLKPFERDRLLAAWTEKERAEKAYTKLLASLRIDVAKAFAGPEPEK